MFKNILKISIISLIFLLIMACKSKVKPETAVQLVDNQQTFASPQLAAEALENAAANADYAKLMQIFGPQGKDLLQSGDEVTDRQALADFSEAIAEDHSIVTLQSLDPATANSNKAPQVALLIVGSQEWPFPVPLFEENNRWRFDTLNGKQEIINRRIGQNEIEVIQLADEYVNAQLEYYAIDRDGDKVLEYAQKFISTPGKQDGLYWEPVEGQALSPIGPLIAVAEGAGYQAKSGSAPQPFHGYFYKILTSQSKNARGGAFNYIKNGKITGGFALLAYPAKWDVSGAMTFLVGPDGMIFQKNLGPDTAKIAPKINSYNPDFSWIPVQ